VTTELVDATSTPPGILERLSGPQRVLVRRVAAIVVVLSVLALATMAIVTSQAEPATRVAEVREQPARSAAAAPAPPGGPGPVTLPPVSPAALDRPSVPAPRGGLPAVVPAAAAAPAPAPAPPAPPAAVPAMPAAAPADCPALGLPAPTETGGLASVIALVPLFGPFSAEAFAMLPAFEPALPVIGPLFPPAERALESLAPLLDAITPGAQALGQAGFDLLAPFYGPVREQFLSAETDLATAIAPLVQALATAPGTECLVALEGVLTSLLPGAPAATG
jgi:hypothetical protein